jgi:putative FmdB family regulatory protein
VAAYDFTCERCGDFEVRRPMAEAAKPASCPSCRGEARRLFAAPLTYRSSPLAREALGREELSRHEPRRAGRPSGAPMPHVHGGPSQPWTISH